MDVNQPFDNLAILNYFKISFLSKNDGSLVIYPLKYARNKIFGTIGIDTLQEKVKKNNTVQEI